MVSARSRTLPTSRGDVRQASARVSSDRASSSARARATRTSSPSSHRRSRALAPRRGDEHGPGRHRRGRSRPPHRPADAPRPTPYEQVYVQGVTTFPVPSQLSGPSIRAEHADQCEPPTVRTIRTTVVGEAWERCRPDDAPPLLARRRVQRRDARAVDRARQHQAGTGAETHESVGDPPGLTVGPEGVDRTVGLLRAGRPRCGDHPGPGTADRGPKGKPSPVTRQTLGPGGEVEPEDQRRCRRCRRRTGRLARSRRRLHASIDVDDQDVAEHDRRTVDHPRQRLGPSGIAASPGRRRSASSSWSATHRPRSSAIGTTTRSSVSDRRHERRTQGRRRHRSSPVSASRTTTSLVVTATIASAFAASRWTSAMGTSNRGSPVPASSAVRPLGPGGHDHRPGAGQPAQAIAGAALPRPSRVAGREVDGADDLFARPDCSPAPPPRRRPRPAAPEVRSPRGRSATARPHR